MSLKECFPQKFNSFNDLKTPFAITINRTGDKKKIDAVAPKKYIKIIP